MAYIKLNDFLCDVQGVVEATRYEQHLLWVENDGYAGKMTWKENLLGRHETVGYLDDMPVCVSLSTAVIDGRKILFYTPTSQVVDHRKIQTWLRENLPKSAFHDDDNINEVDAQNFHNLF